MAFTGRLWRCEYGKPATKEAMEMERFAGADLQTRMTQYAA
jgi:hypothetical protein